MTHHAISLSGAAVHARPSGALWWADAGLLAVSDLHLGRAARGAIHGGALLPPYETAATLDRLEGEGLVAFRYVDDRGEATDAANRNGSARNIRGSET